MDRCKDVVEGWPVWGGEEQELLPFPEHLSSPPVLSRVRVTLSLVSCVCFVDRHFSFGHYLSINLRILINH